jgi:hypothetical protein
MLARAKPATWGGTAPRLLHPLDHHRFSVRMAGVIRNCYLMTPASALVPALERERAGGLRTWERIFRERGYIPTGIGAGSVADRRWDDLSDSGGYAHLIAACAQYVNLKNGATDWGQWDYPGDAAPRAAPAPAAAGSGP